MQHQTLKYFRHCWILLILGVNLAVASDNSEKRMNAYLAYAPSLLLFEENQFRDLPKLSLGSRLYGQSYPPNLLLHGLNAAIFIDKSWRAGAVINLGRHSRSGTIADSSYWENMFLGSSSVFLEYVLRPSSAVSLFGSLSAGLLFLRFESQAVFGTPDWDTLFQYPNGENGMNSISAGPLFLLQPTAGVEAVFGGHLLLRLSGGLFVCRIEKSDWQLNQSMPLADGISLEFNQAFIQLGIGICR